MRIAQIISGTGLNGSVRHGYELAGELASLGHQVNVLYREGSWLSQQPFPQEIFHQPISFQRKPQNLRTIAKLLRDRQVEVIHSHNSSAHFLTVLLARIFKFRCVATTHMTFFQPHWWWNDRVIAPGRSAARFQRWVNAVPMRRIDVIPNFIRSSKMAPSCSRKEARQRLRISPKTFVIAVIGEVCQRKAQHRLIEVLPQVIRAGIDPLVLLIGSVSATYQSTLERAIHEARVTDQVRVLGMRTDIPDLLAAADCGCLPSQREVMPISILEGMSVGLPFVATDVGGVRDCIRDEIDGIIVPRNQPLALAAALIRLGSDEALRCRMGLNSQQQIRERFSPEACVPQILSSYAAACA